MSSTIAAPIAIFALLSASIVSAQTAPSVAGVWRQEDGSATVRVANCKDSTNWCATVIDERIAPGEPSLLNQMVVRDMRPNGKKGWVGRYVADGQSMKASAKMLRADTMSFKVCAVAFLCETIKLNRVR